MTARTGKVMSGGFLQVPAEMLHELGLTEGMAVTMRVVDGTLQVRPLRDVVAKVQAELRKYVSPGRSLSEELIAERRAAAAEE